MTSPDPVAQPSEYQLLLIAGHDRFHVAQARRTLSEIRSQG